MGHDVSVHRQYYRLQDSTLELAKVSKLLLAVDEGNVGNFSGKKLNEITLEGKYFDITSWLYMCISLESSLNENFKKQSISFCRQWFSLATGFCIKKKFQNISFSDFKCWNSSCVPLSPCFIVSKVNPTWRRVFSKFLSCSGACGPTRTRNVWW